MAETEEPQTKPFSLPWLNSGLKQQVLEKQKKKKFIMMMIIKVLGARLMRIEFLLASGAQCGSEALAS